MWPLSAAPPALGFRMPNCTQGDSKVVPEPEHALKNLGPKSLQLTWLDGRCAVPEDASQLEVPVLWLLTKTNMIIQWQSDCSLLICSLDVPEELFWIRRIRT